MEKKKYEPPVIDDHRPLVFETSASGSRCGSDGDGDSDGDGWFWWWR